MVRLAAIVFGIAFIFAGVAGFMPQFVQNGLLFGLFQVDSMHNTVHLLSGVIAIMAATKYRYSKLYFELFGIFYAIVAILGFILNGDFGFMMMQFNTADNFLHTGIAIVSLYIGFATQSSSM